MAINLPIIERRLLEKQLFEKSAIVAYDSITALEEFERFEEEFLPDDSSGQDHGE